MNQVVPARKQARKGDDASERDRPSVVAQVRSGGMQFAACNRTSVDGKEFIPVSNKASLNVERARNKLEAAEFERREKTEVRALYTKHESPGHMLGDSYIGSVMEPLSMVLNEERISQSLNAGARRGRPAYQVQSELCGAAQANYRWCICGGHHRP